MSVSVSHFKRVMRLAAAVTLLPITALTTWNVLFEPRTCRRASPHFSPR